MCTAGVGQHPVAEGHVDVVVAVEGVGGVDVGADVRVARRHCLALAIARKTNTCN